MKKNSKLLIILAISIIVNIRSAKAQYNTNIFLDHFDGSAVSNLTWFYPWWISQNDGTYLGRTQTRTAQNESLPLTQNSEVNINLDTYNRTGGSFYGTDLISIKSFHAGNGIIFSVRAKVNPPIQKGVVFGIYGYELTVPGLRGWSSIASNSDGTKLVTTVTGGDIWTTSNSGVSWAYQKMTGPHIWNDIASSSDGTKLVAIVTRGNIWTSVNSGNSWTERIIPGLNEWIAVASSSDGTKLIAVALRGNIWTSSNSGVTWTSHPAAGFLNWYEVASSGDGTKLVAVVYGGSIWTSSDSGVTWTERTGPGLNNWTSVASSLDGTKYAAVSMGGGVWTSADAGLSWINQTSLDSPYLKGITSSSDGTKLAVVGNYGGNVWTSANSGLNWTKRSGPELKDGNFIASSSDGSKLTVAVFAGNIWRSEDLGATWINQSGSDQTLHDEIDFELLTNNLNKVYTNIYRNAPMGVGSPDSVFVTSPVTDYHIYSIEWLKTGVTWKVDGNIIKTDNDSPQGPMRFNLNAWAPDINWKAAYNGSLQWTTVSSENQTYSMIVDYVRVDSLTDIPTSMVDVKTPDEISFFPNPAGDQITLVGNKGETNVMVIDLMGKILINKKVFNVLSTSELKEGIYLIKLGGRPAQKLVVNKR